MPQKRKSVCLAIIFAIALASSVSAAFVWKRLSNRPASGGAGQTGGTPASPGAGFSSDAVAQQPGSALGDIQISPMSATERGVALNSAFLVQAGADTDISSVKGRLSVKTGEPFSVVNTSDKKNEFELHFANRLAANRIYNILYSPEGKRPVSFAFQTEPGFSAVSSVPVFSNGGDSGISYNVPVNSGIEITFTEPPGLDWQSHFHISPPVNGSFSISGRKTIFIPESLESGTKYTVYIDSGLTGRNGDPIDQAYQIVFYTESPDSSVKDISLYGGAYENFLPDDDIILRFLLSERYKLQEFIIDVYEMPDPAAFAKYYENNKATVSGSLKKLESISTGLFVPPESKNAPFDAYLSLDRLPEGYYLVHVSAGDVALNKMVQVNRLSVYSLSIDGDICFWVNDSSTGGAAPGATINRQNDRTVTDAGGVALMRHKTAGTSPVTVQYRDAPVFVYNGSGFEPPEKALAEKYYHYICTDRAQYHANDSISVFGVIRETDPEYRLSASDAITVSLGDMETAGVKADKYGGFSHTFNVSNMRGRVDVRVEVNGEALVSIPVAFAEYNKDKYIINAETDRKVYFSDETPNVNVSVSTYDGAPVQGLKLELAAGPAQQSTVTDSSGLASAQLALGKGRSPTPYFGGATISTVSADEFLQVCSQPFIILDTDVMLEHEALEDGSIAFKSSRIDRAAIENAYNSGGADPYSPEIYRGGAVDLNFSLAVHEIKVAKEKISERYDYVLSQNVPEYRYASNDSIVETHMLSTNNGVLTVADLPKGSDPDKYYYAFISYKDSKGREAGFTFDLTDRVLPPAASGYSFEFTKDDNKMKLGETAGFRLTGETSGEGRALSVLTNNGVLSASVNGPGNIPIVFSDDCMYSVQVFGAYFDGKHVYPVQRPITVRYDPADQKLNVQIKMDKDQYEPGGEGLLNVTVTDWSGSPKQALVNVCFVDEAAFPAMNKRAYDGGDFLEEFYGSASRRWADYSIYTSYGRIPSDAVFKVSNESAALDSAGPGDASTNIRKDFRDNPVFETVETDPYGKAALPIKFGDSVTSWRITSHAVSADYCAGSSTLCAVTSLPFYIDLVLADEFVQGDHIEALVKPYGKSYAYGENLISYSYKLEMDGETLAEGKKQAERQSGMETFGLGTLSPGEYKLTVSAEMMDFVGGGMEYADALERVFHVNNAGVRMNLLASKTISADQPQMPAIAPVESPVNISLCNADYAFIIEMLNGMLCRESPRTDHIAASAFASGYLSGESGGLPRLRGEIPWAGGVPELSYGSGEPVYTARFCAAFPDIVDKGLINAYVNDTLGMYADNMPAPASNDSMFELNRAAGYFLLAATGGAVLNEIDGQAKALEGTKALKNLYLRKMLYAAAYCAAGADAKANELVTSAMLMSNNGGEESAEIGRALQFYVNASLNPPAAIEYLQTPRNYKYVSDVCECVNFIRKSKPLQGLIAEASLTVGGNTESVKLKGYDAFYKSITVENYRGMLLSPVSGSVRVNFSYSGRSADFDAMQNIIGLEKSINPENSSQFSVAFKVSMPEGSEPGYYTIRDRVPSNMRFIQTRGDGYMVNYLEKQLVDIYFYYDGEKQPEGMRYRAIQVAAADAVVERAYISQGFWVDKPWGASK